MLLLLKRLDKTEYYAHTFLHLQRLLMKRKDMDIVKEIKAILALQDPDEKDGRLSVLNSEFEYDHELNKANVMEGTQLLLTAALREGNKALRKKFFRTIDQAVVYQNIGDCITWDPDRK